MPDRSKVIQMAISQIGYLEKSKSAYQKDPGILDSMTAGAGYDNYTKYGRDMHAIYPSTSLSGNDLKTVRPHYLSFPCTFASARLSS